MLNVFMVVVGYVPYVIIGLFVGVVVTQWLEYTAAQVGSGGPPQATSEEAFALARQRYYRFLVGAMYASVLANGVLLAVAVHLAGWW